MLKRSQEYVLKQYFDVMKKNFSKQGIVSTFFAVVLLLSMYHCTTKETQEVDEGKMNGEELARTYCGSCHLYPDPALLPKAYWQEVLPKMAVRLGLKSTYNPYEGRSMQESFNMDNAGVFPKEPLLADSSWQKIVAFYQQQAPDSLPLMETESQQPSLLFQPSFVSLNSTSPPIVTMLEIDTSAHKIHYGDASGYLYDIDSNFDVTARLKLPSPPVDVKQTSNPGELLVLNIGLMNPNDIETGIVVTTKSPGFPTRDLAFTGLARPVDFEVGLLDEDEIEDIVVCHFGYETGRFSWYKKVDGEYQERVLKNVPGASKVLLRDVDADADLDLVVLFAQGDEGVSIFYNNGGQFREERILRVPPIYGSSDFEFLDMDQDGDMDIVLANGDNGDKTFILKPYHGIRVYLNKGNFEYEEHYFFPMYGATKVRARDFDQDGDFDLIASSFFSDYDDLGRKGIVYLENEGDFQFAPHHFPEAKKGRWLVMDAGDVDQDGDEDIILGSFVQGLVAVPEAVLANWQASTDPVLFLENTLK